MGDVMVKFSDGSQILVQNVHHVPELSRSLLSVGQLENIGFKVIFAVQSFCITKGKIGYCLREQSWFTLSFSFPSKGASFNSHKTTYDLYLAWAFRSHVSYWNGNIITFWLFTYVIIFKFFSL